MRYGGSAVNGTLTISDVADGDGYFEIWLSDLQARVEDYGGKARTTFNLQEQVWVRGTLKRNDGALIPVQYCGEILVGTEDRILAAGAVDSLGGFETHFMAYDLPEGTYSLTVLYPGYPPMQPATRPLGDIKGGITYFTANPLSALEGELLYCDFEVKNWDTWWAHNYRVTLVATSSAWVGGQTLYTREVSLGAGKSFGYHGSTGLLMPAADVRITLILERQEIVEGWIEQGRKSVTIAYIASPGPEADLYVLPDAQSFTITVTSGPPEEGLPWWVFLLAAGGGLGAAYLLTRRRAQPYPMYGMVPYG